MSDAATNVAVLKDAYHRWHESKGGSVDHWMTLVAEDIKFGSLAQAAPEMAFARTYSNRDALRGYFDGLVGDWEMIHYTTDEFVAEGEPRVHARVYGMAQQADRQDRRNA